MCPFTSLCSLDNLSHRNSPEKCCNCCSRSSALAQITSKCMHRVPVSFERLEVENMAVVMHDGVSPLDSSTSRREKPFSDSLFENTLFVIAHISFDFYSRLTYVHDCHCMCFLCVGVVYVRMCSTCAPH